MREMRRTDRQLTKEEAMEILVKGEYGILSTVDGDGQPYGVPLSYVVKDDCIYYHCTDAGGSKQDNIQNNSKVSFTVVGNTQVLPEKFGTLYEGAIAFGEAAVVSDEEEKLTALRDVIKKYCAGYIAEGEKYIAASGPKTLIVRIAIREVTGKSRK
jgi:nitroimidazol reductase NimA-like FMN-containing flavoprotein (pyridoxamine 5'-phosphate oxidase superfamily)